jgi:predicted nucleic acid-binding Zn ribbon protein
MNGMVKAYRCISCANHFKVEVGHFDDVPMSPPCPRCGQFHSKQVEV